MGTKSTFIRTCRRVRFQARDYEVRFGLVTSRKHRRAVVCNSLSMDARVNEVLRAFKTGIEARTKRKYYENNH
jgi:hypothetical protein